MLLMLTKLPPNIENDHKRKRQMLNYWKWNVLGQQKIKGSLRNSSSKYNERCLSSDTKNIEKMKKDETLFCFSLESKLKRWPPQLITKAQLQILQVINDIETMSDSTVRDKMPSEVHAFPLQPSNWCHPLTSRASKFLYQQGSMSEMHDNSQNQTY